MTGREALIIEIAQAIERAFLSCGRKVLVQPHFTLREWTFLVTEPREDGPRGIGSLTFADRKDLDRRLAIAGVPGFTTTNAVGEKGADDMWVSIDSRLVGAAGFDTDAAEALEIVHTDQVGFALVKEDPERAIASGAACRLDATAVVLSLSLPVLHRIDQVAPLIQGLAGVPYKRFATKVTAASLSAYFGVTTPSEISLSMLNSARRAARLVPPKDLVPVADGALPVSEILVFRTIDVLSRIGAGHDPQRISADIDAVRKEWADMAKGLVATREGMASQQPGSKVPLTTLSL